jgi:hypothetical protein
VRSASTPGNFRSARSQIGNDSSTRRP